ncbi:hypothetical protein FRB91_006066 [Serendipita sp. 411]|nr:hypothetical protein FRB91_006066 [Serendipita sp. 411]
MSTPAINTYKLRRQEFPITLYGVDYPGSQTAYSEEEGFQADSDFTPYYTTGLRNAVEYHLDWQCRIPSPFISTFSNREHARNWARTWRENNDNEMCYIVEMRIKANDGVTVFRLADLVNELDIPTSLHASQYRSEYLCFRHIPAETVVRVEAAPRPAAGRTSIDNQNRHYDYDYDSEYSYE